MLKMTVYNVSKSKGHWNIFVDAEPGKNVIFEIFLPIFKSNESPLDDAAQNEKSTQ